MRRLEAYFEVLQELDQMQGIEFSSLISTSPSLGVMGLLIFSRNSIKLFNVILSFGEDILNRIKQFRISRYTFSGSGTLSLQPLKFVCFTSLCVASCHLLPLSISAKSTRVWNAILWSYLIWVKSELVVHNIGIYGHVSLASDRLVTANWSSSFIWIGCLLRNSSRSLSTISHLPIS